MKMSTAFRGACVSWRLSYPVSGAVGRGSDGTRVQELLVESTDTMREYLERYQRARRPIKFNMSLHIEFVQATDDTIVTSPPVVLVTPQHEVYAATDINSVLSDCVKQLDDRIVEFEGNGSGWVVNRLLLLDTTAWRLDPLRGRSSHDLPEWIRNTHCVINPQNSDNECFRHAVMIALYYERVPSQPHRNRISAYAQFYGEPDAPKFEGLIYPLTLKDIEQFERQNPEISVNVYAEKTYIVRG